MANKTGLRHRKKTERQKVTLNKRRNRRQTDMEKHTGKTKEYKKIDGLIVINTKERQKTRNRNTDKRKKEINRMKERKTLQTLV